MSDSGSSSWRIRALLGKFLYDSSASSILKDVGGGYRSRHDNYRNFTDRASIDSSAIISPGGQCSRHHDDIIKGALCSHGGSRMIILYNELLLKS